MRLSTKTYLLSALLTTTLLLATNPKSTPSQEMLPSILSSATEIELHQPITIKPDIPLYTPQLSNIQNCTTKKKKKRVECSYVNDSPKPLTEFTFQSTTNKSTKSITKNQTFKKANLSSLSIDKPKLTLTFKAPKNKEGKRVQHIGAIEDSSRVSTYIFHQGDYYIDSLKIESQADKKNDLFTLKTKGKVRIFLNQDSYIIKRDDEYKKRAYIELGYHKNPSNLIILSKNNLTIDASRRLKTHSIIYSYSDLNLICNKNSTIKGAIHANGTLAIGKEIAKHHKQEEAGEFVYDGGAVGRLNLEFDTGESTDSVAPVITLNGDSNISLLQDEAYEELGATAIDDRDGNVSVEISGEVDSATIGTYTITYTARDSSGNVGSVGRVVNVVSSEPALKSLVLSMEKTNFIRQKELFQEGYSSINEKIKVIGKYTDGHSEELTDRVEYKSSMESMKFDNNSFYAHTDGNATIAALLNGVVSNKVTVYIEKEKEKDYKIDILNNDKSKLGARGSKIIVSLLKKPTADVKLKFHIDPKDDLILGYTTTNHEKMFSYEINFEPEKWNTQSTSEYIQVIDTNISSNGVKPYTIITNNFISDDPYYDGMIIEDIIVKPLNKVKLTKPFIGELRGAMRGVTIRFSITSKQVGLAYQLDNPPSGMKIERRMLQKIGYFGSEDIQVDGVNILWNVPMNLEEKTYTITIKATNISNEKGEITFSIKVPKTKYIQTKIINNELVVTDRNSKLYGMKMKGHNGEDISNLKLRNVDYDDVWKYFGKPINLNKKIEYKVFIVDNMPAMLDIKFPQYMDTFEKRIKLGAGVKQYMETCLVTEKCWDWRDDDTYSYKYEKTNGISIPYKYGNHRDESNGSRVFIFTINEQLLGS